MARFLALDWDHNQLHVVLANVSGGGVRVLRAAVWREDAPVTPADAVAVGERLKERLKEAKFPAAPVLACLGRDRLIVKEVRYPAVPPHEEPGVIRFQALKELTGAAEDVVIDYAPTGEAANGERRAMVLVVKRDLVTAQQELCKAAGLRLAGVTPRSFGLAACIDRLAGTTVLMPPPEPADAAVGVLAVSEGEAEFCVSRGGTLLMSRSLVAGPNLAAEVRRSLAVFGGQSAAQPVRAVYVAGGRDNAALRERLHNLLELPVHLLDPFAGGELPEQPAPDTRGGFVGLVGLLYLRAARAGLPVNFVAPKQPKPPADPNTRKLLYGGVVAAAVLLALGALAYLEISKLDRQVKTQAAKIKSLDNDLLALDEDEKRIKAVGAWNDQNVDWLDELYDLTARFPDPDADNIRLTSLTADVVEKSAAAKDKDKHVAKMALKGVSGNDNKPVDLLVSHFGADGYQPDPKQMKPNRGPEARQGFTQEFEIKKVNIDKHTPQDYKRRLDDEGEVTDRRPRGRGGR